MCISHSRNPRDERAHRTLPREASRVSPLSVMPEGGRAGSSDTKESKKGENHAYLYLEPIP
jgi:hypothetical protein